MRQLLLIILANFLLISTNGQDLPGAMKLPDFIQPSPEASSILKASNLSINYATGSPNISIPIGTIGVNGIKLPINVSYNSTGIKVDEYSSTLGAGWSCSTGGVISRTILGRPDESRVGTSYPTNLNSINFNNQNAALLNFLKNTVDAESDIFNFSFLGYSGKFILDSTLQEVIPLSTYNMRIKPISGNFLNGFTVVTDDGATYKFDVEETSKSRNPLGSNCPKSYEYADNKTSWYLSKITGPNKRTYMNFTYITQNILFEQSINQYIAKCISTQNHCCGYPDDPWNNCPSGPAQAVGTETFYTCVTRQLVSSKFLSKIVTSANDTVSFTYDSSPRQDLDSGKRLKQIVISNRNGKVINKASFYTSYSSGIGSSSYTNSNKRMYLDAMTIENGTDTANSLPYQFEYFSKSGVSARLCFGQDLYGYSNGMISNPSLLPILPTTDINYSSFNNGTGGTSVSFGNRSIDTVYAMKGLLNKIIYPTGGYDSIIYRPNRYYNDSTDVLAGGSSVYRIFSYTFGQKVLDKSFSYLDTNNHSSTVLLNTLTRCSERSTVITDGYTCQTSLSPNSLVIKEEGPSYVIANVTSNLIAPITTLGGQHAYHHSVTEKIIGNKDNGFTQHHYALYSSLYPYDLMGNSVLSAPLQVVNDVLIGEDFTKVYRYDTATSSYKPVKYVRNYIGIHNFVSYHNYVIKKNFMPAVTENPPASYEFHPFDVTKYAINQYNVYTDGTREVTYDLNNDSFVVVTVTEHGNSAHSYPTKQKSFLPDGDSLETRYSYPLDGSASILTARNIVSPVLEEKKYKNGTLLSTVTNSYASWFSDSSVVALQQVEYKELTNSMPVHVNYLAYDSVGNVLDLAKDSGLHKSYIWGYNKQYPIAGATNAAQNEIFYTSFEESDGSTDSNAKTGGKSHSGNYTVSFSLPNGKSYVLTYWAWDGSQWVYHEAAYTGSTTITASKVDEVRVLPADALMVTATFEPMQGITSQCDQRNQVTYFEYDNLNRIKLIRDANRKIIKLFDYKYQQ